MPNILILNAPCNGYGDIVFGMKLKKYLEEWYKCCKIYMATTYNNKGALKLKGNILPLVPKVAKKDYNCLYFNEVKFKNKKDSKHIFDIVFVAPLVIGNPNLEDVQTLLPYIEKSQVFWFSEYNNGNNNFDFQTGVGPGDLGLFLTNPNITKPRSKKLKNKYSFIYVANIKGVDKCISSFLEMICKKYKDNEHFDIVVPSWFSKKNITNSSMKKIQKDWSEIRIKDSKGKNTKLFSVKQDISNILTFRADILPVENDVMLGLIKHSVRDILLTGDQSITDALSCCPSKNIFYQTAPWKKDFAYYLGKTLPNKYLVSENTSCGNLKALKYKSNYNKFIQKWDFRKKGKKLIDKIVKESKDSRKRSDNRSHKRSDNRSRRRSGKRSDNRSRRRSDKRSRKRSGKKKPRRKSCKYGRKKSGGCKKKPGPKKRSKKKSRRKSCKYGRKQSGGCKKKSRRKSCKYGRKKSGGCKKKPGPKKRSRR